MAAQTADDVIKYICSYVEQYEIEQDSFADRNALGGERGVTCNMEFLNVVTLNENSVIDPQNEFKPVQELLNKIREITGHEDEEIKEPDLAHENT